MSWHLLGENFDWRFRRGSTVLYAIIAASVLAGFGAFAVDYGHRAVARMELQNAADAAARYAAEGISDSTYAAKAIAAAGQNYADGTSVVISSSDVTVGTYNSTTGLFTAGGSSPNAVRVVAARRNGNGISTVALRAFGLTNLNVSATGYAVATTSSSGGTAPTSPGLIGVNWFNTSAATVDSWDSSTNTTKGGAIGGTNASANMNSMTFNGRFYAGTSGSMTNNGSTFTQVSSLSSNYSFSMPTTPSSGVTNMGNYNGPSGSSQTFAAGKYYFDSFTVPSGKTVIFSGAVELYINGSCQISGDMTTYHNDPSNTKIRMVCSAGVDINAGTAPVYLDVYAPSSPMNVNGRSRAYGSFVAGGISLTSTHISIDKDIGSTTSGTWTFGTPSTDVSTVLPR